MATEKIGAPVERPMPELWKVDAVCEALTLSAPSVYRLMESGELPYVRLGRCRRVRRDDVLALIERMTIRRG